MPAVSMEPRVVNSLSQVATGSPSPFGTREPHLVSFPSGFEAKCDRSMIDDALVALDGARPVATLGVLLRIASGPAQILAKYKNGDYRFDFELRNSFQTSIARVRDYWAELTHDEPAWRHVQELPGIHACLLRGRVDKLKQFVDSRLLQAADSPVAGLLMGDSLATPETAACAARARMAAGEELATILESFGRECYSLGQRGKDPSTISLIAQSDAICASIFGTEFWRRVTNFFGLPEETFDAEAFLSSTDAANYLGNLGIGDVDSWGQHPAQGHTVCVIDSGADESHPMLQQRVKDYARFDSHGNFKEAYACMDHGCHGTKMAAQICGNSVDVGALGAGHPGRFRLGIAAGARAVVVSAMGGELRQETATWPQFLNALNWAAESSVPLGHEVINISMESLTPIRETTRLNIDRALGLLIHKGIVPILAAGNNGENSFSLGEAGTYVGALTANGSPATTNGAQVDLLGPGTNLVCAHPLTHRLNGLFLGRYTGSSLSAAILSGCILVVSALSRVSASRALEALTATANDQRFNVDRALEALR